MALWISQKVFILLIMVYHLCSAKPLPKPLSIRKIRIIRKNKLKMKIHSIFFQEYIFQNVCKMSAMLFTFQSSYDEMYVSMNSSPLYQWCLSVLLLIWHPTIVWTNIDLSINRPHTMMFNVKYLQIKISSRNKNDIVFNFSPVLW